MKKALIYAAIFIVILVAFSYFNRKDSSLTPVENIPVVKIEHKIKSATFDEDSDSDLKKIIVTWDDSTKTEVTKVIPERIQSVEIVDINFDGADDLMVTVSAGAYNAYTYFYTLDTLKKDFPDYTAFNEVLSEDGGYPSLGFVSFDSTHKTLKSFFKGRGLGDLYISATYAFKNGTWQKVEIESQDILNYEKSQDYYVKNIVQFENGATTTEKTQYFKVKTPGDIGNLVEVSKSEIQSKGLIK